MDKPPSGKGSAPLKGPEPPGEPVTPKAPTTDTELLAECRVDTFRAGGKGGQHQNKTESGVRLTHGPTGIVVTVRSSRSQARNRQAALDRLRKRIDKLGESPTPRIRTRVPLKEKRRRVEDKKKRSKVKQRRRKPEIDDG